MSLSNEIRKLRFDHGEMTQQELAKRVGVSRQTVNAIETNKHAPSLDVAIRIADVFETSVNDVFEFDYDGKPDLVMVTVIFRADPDQIEAACSDPAASLPSEAL
jgi:putative transcriptional regulator